MFFLVSCNFCYRDSQKYGVPRPSSIQGDEQQKIQYNQMLSGRNLQQPGAVPATRPGARMMPGAHGVGMMTGVHRQKTCTQKCATSAKCCECLVGSHVCLW